MLSSVATSRSHPRITDFVALNALLVNADIHTKEIRYVLRCDQISKIGILQSFIFFYILWMNFHQCGLSILLNGSASLTINCKLASRIISSLMGFFLSDFASCCCIKISWWTSGWTCEKQKFYFQCRLESEVRNEFKMPAHFHAVIELLQFTYLFDMTFHVGVISIQTRNRTGHPWARFYSVLCTNITCILQGSLLIWCW